MCVQGAEVFLFEARAHRSVWTLRHSRERCIRPATRVYLGTSLVGHAQAVVKLDWRVCEQQRLQVVVTVASGAEEAE